MGNRPCMLSWFSVNDNKNIYIYIIKQEAHLTHFSGALTDIKMSKYVKIKI